MSGPRRPIFASRLTQRWARAYTAHLDPARRDTRRAELPSDLWELEADARRLGLGSLRVNVMVLRRLVAGIPADLSWRRHPPDAAPVLTALAPVVAPAHSSPWVCRVRGHHYITKRTPNNLNDGGTYRVCERCNDEKRPPRGPPAHWGIAP